MKFKFGYDDALDVVGIHLVGGILGSLLLGFFADSGVNPAAADGWFNGGGSELLGKQLLAVGATLVWSFVVTFVIAKAIAVTVGLRAKTEDELMGLDISLHGESGYHLSGTDLIGSEATAEGHPDARGTAAVTAKAVAV